MAVTMFIVMEIIPAWRAVRGFSASLKDRTEVHLTHRFGRLGTAMRDATGMIECRHVTTEGPSMNAIRIHKKLNSQILDLPELAPLLGKTVEIIVIEEVPDNSREQDRKPGSAQGEVKMSGDFDAPLDDFAPYIK